MKKRFFQIALGSLFSASSMVAGAFSGSANDFDSPITLAYDFSESSVEDLVIAQNEITSLEEIATVEQPHTAEVQSAHR